MQSTSISLLDLLKDGEDEQAWQTMVTIYQPLIKKWLGRLGTPANELGDLSQNVMTVVVRKLPEFEHGGRTGAFRSWLRNITRNCLLEFWRKNKQTPVATGKSEFQEQLNQLADQTSELSQMWDREYDEHVLASLMTVIRPEFRSQSWEAFELFVLEGIPATDVAERLGVSANSVFIAKSRIMMRLREVGKYMIE